MQIDMVLTKTRIHAGVWEGVLSMPGAEKPDVLVTHLEQPVLSVEVDEIADREGEWLVRVAIPPDLLSDGVQTFLISDKASGVKLSSFAIVTGEPLEDDIRAELDLLRAELDMLKKAFRRHCVETG
jgi:hypothetical protein